MRTTLTIEDDITARLEAHSMSQQAQRFRTKPRKLGLRSGFDPGKLNQLVDELAVEAGLAKLGKFD